MLLVKMAATRYGSKGVLVGASLTGIEIQRSLEDALKWNLRDGNAMKADGNKEVMDKSNLGDKEVQGNNYYEMTRVLSLMQMDAQRFNHFLKKIGWEDVMESDENGMNRVHRDNIQVLCRIVRDRSID